MSRLLIFLNVTPNSLESMYHTTSQTAYSHQAKYQAVQQIFHSPFIEIYQTLIFRIIYGMLMGNDVYISMSKKLGGNVLHFKYRLCCVL